MDEPCSALDPIVDGAHRGPHRRARERATRSSSSPTTCSRRRACRTDRVLHVDGRRDDRRVGMLVEYDDTEKIFTNPRTRAPRTTSRAVRMRVALEQDLTTLEMGIGAQARCGSGSCWGARWERCVPAMSSSLTRSSTAMIRWTTPTWRSASLWSRSWRRAAPGGRRSAAGARSARRERAPRAHGRLLRDDREADPAGVRASRGRRHGRAVHHAWASRQIG